MRRTSRYHTWWWNRTQTAHLPCWRGFSTVCGTYAQNEDDSQLSFHESSPALRSLRHAQPPSLMLAGFSWRSASSLHRCFLSSAFNSSPLLRLLLKGGPLFSLKSYRRIDRLLGHSTGERRERGVVPAYASPWRFFSEHARFQTYPAEKQKFIPDLRPLI